MKLEMFDFIDDVISDYDDIKNELFLACRFLEFYFQELLSNNVDKGFLNINTRVKSETSLREKIIRNNYYKIYKESYEVLENIHDLIGIRIECRFSNDEDIIYNLLKSLFNKKHKDGTYYSVFDKSVRINLSRKQPEIQKNGFKIYRLDGLYDTGRKELNFELQIKSLVNTFWSEIEHKVIYKNYNYILGEDLFSSMLKSVKDNLQIIDNQLLTMYNHFNKLDSVDPINKKLDKEMLLSKLVYDVFTIKVKEDLGFAIDFRKVSDLIIDYLAYLSRKEKLYNYDDLMLMVIGRLNKFNVSDISFSQQIVLDRDLTLDSEHEVHVCQAIEDVINLDLKWNVFFKILTVLKEKGIAHNIENFSKFILYKLYKISSLVYINANSNASSLCKDIYLLLIDYFLKTKSIEILYESSINELSNNIEDFIFTLEYEQTERFSEYWEKKKTELKGVLNII